MWFPCPSCAKRLSSNFQLKLQDNTRAAGQREVVLTSCSPQHLLKWIWASFYWDHVFKLSFPEADPALNGRFGDKATSSPVENMHPLHLPCPYPCQVRHLQQQSWLQLLFAQVLDCYFGYWCLFLIYLFGCGVQYVWPRIEPVSSVLDAWSLNHWITRKVPGVC